MLRKLVRAVFTIVGAVLGYGAFLLVKFLARFFGHDDWVELYKHAGVLYFCIIRTYFWINILPIDPDDQETGQ